MAESAFSVNGKYYAAISEDGRLRIWDTEANILKQEYTPDLHLTSPPSCLQWINVQTGVKKQRKRDSISENETQCIALGTFSGKILIYSVSQAKIEAVFEKLQSRVTAIDWHGDYGLYTCSKDYSLCEWDLTEGDIRHKYKIHIDSKSKQGNHVSAIKIIPHKLNTKAHFVIAASCQVRLWRLDQGQASVVKTLGHNASQTALLSLATVNDVCWLIEGSQNERLLTFWDVTIRDDKPQMNGDSEPSKKKRRSLTNVPTSSPSYSFVLEDAARMVDLEVKDEGQGVKLSLVAVTRSGVVHYYGHMLNGSSTKPFKPTVTVQSTTPSAVPLPLQCCRLTNNGDLLLGYSRDPVLLFETVTPDLKSKTQVLIRGENRQTKRAKQAADTSKVRSDGGAGARVNVVEPMGGVTRKRVAPGAQVEVPMEARLANLSLKMYRDRNKSGSFNNYSKLLTQGLHSRDREIINSVLYKNSAEVAGRTVSALPAECVPALLEELAEMAASNTNLCSCVCVWLGALLRHHAALLLACISAQRTAQLTHLLAVFTHRRSHLCQLLNLKGRLELTLRQRTAPAPAPAPARADHEPLLDYNDTSSDDEEIGELKYKSDSEASWDDNNFGAASGEERGEGRGEENGSDDGDDDEMDGSGHSDDDDDDE